MSRFQELDAERDVITKEMYALATEHLSEFEFTEEQIRTLSNSFWKWLNEGMGEDYFPNDDFLTSEMLFLLAECRGSSYELQMLFEPKGVEFE